MNEANCNIFNRSSLSTATRLSGDWNSAAAGLAGDARHSILRCHRSPFHTGELMRRNRLRELLNADLPSLGTHIHSSWPTIIELAGHSGMFDYVEFVGEYAPYDLYALENLGRAVDLFDHMSGMMKIEQEPRTYLTIRSIGSGIQNVLFADPRTVADVEECVRAVRAEAPHAR